MYVVPQKHIVNRAAEIKKIHKMSAHNVSVKLVSLSYVRHRNERETVIIDYFLVQMIEGNEK